MTKSGANGQGHGREWLKKIQIWQDACKEERVAWQRVEQDEEGAYPAWQEARKKRDALFPQSERIELRIYPALGRRKG